MKTHKSVATNTPFWENIFRNDSDHKRDIMILLSEMPMFKQLNKNELRKLSKIVYERTYKEGEHFFKEGNPGSAMFIIKQGNVSIEHVRKDGEILNFADVESGDFIGEIALLNDSDRTASARCVTNTNVLVLFRPDFMELVDREVDMGKKIFKELAVMISERLVKTNNMLIDYKKLLEDKHEEE